MAQIFSIAWKDLKVLSRDPLGMFFIVGFPILMGLFFGLMMGGMGSGGSSSKMKVALVDNDQTDQSKRFIELLTAKGNVEMLPGELEPSKEMVRKGKAVGVVALEEGFGERVGVFWGEPPEIQLGMDPSRGAESAMLQGYIMQTVGQMMGDRFSDPADFRSTIDSARDEAKANESINPINRQLLLGFLGTVDSMLGSMEDLQTKQEGSEQEQAMSQPGFEFANVTEIDITRQVDPKSREGQIRKITSQWDISFPQAMLWGILGCIAGFSASIAREQTTGTMTRLQVAPIAKTKILAGKALACFFAVLFVIAMMTVLGYFVGMRPGNILHLCVAAISVSICFVGIMMTLSLLGKTEQSVNGLGWMANMVMAMIGGCMIPVMFMPDFIQKISFLSPVRWAISAIEGAIWRDFTFSEMLLPCGVLIGIGAVGMVVGSAILSRRLS
ncbi:ABC transporter permease [Mariniblastus fucicola]|uniref:ABC-2 family transporter protein n=1 Tax=Mariniblastus fucicola TaxID=980251 RepID=A0A5B9PD16_9BACT|nr:ABC transporter permease [Mariniblastus fucicola]QEG22802.1 ABC-2 family transporter protein [Mariniblastus fucicola]